MSGNHFRNTIDFGIDLGDKKSFVAVATKDGTEVFQTDFGNNYVPSVVWIDKKRTIRVGELAKNRLSIDKDNVKSEFKTFMGKDKTYYFNDSGQELKPEELSAEVLKTLRQIVKQRNNEEMANVIISVPADFKVTQNTATYKASKLAGFKKILLIQDPVAAALAYGAQEESDNALWMVYDFGGGTFDVSIVKILDGTLTLISNSGDTHLGGKNITLDIVNKIFVPYIEGKYVVTNFNLQNSKWIKAFAILKKEAERVKKQLSNLEEVELSLDPLGEDDNGETIIMKCNITQEQLAKIMDPYIEQSLNKCHEAIQNADVKSFDINKMIMVGGQTLSPYLREKVYQDMQITQEYSIDPVTVVVRGAATYAATKKIEIDYDDIPIRPDTFQIIQKSEPTGNSLNPTMAGKVKSFEVASFDGFTIEFTETESQWSSRAIPLKKNGIFKTKVKAEERFNEYKITLKDPQGNIQQTSPDILTYRHVKNLSDHQKLTNSIGIGLSNNTFDIILEEGTPLPTNGRKIYKTSQEILKGSEKEINIPIYEGKNIDKSDRNTFLGFFVIKDEYLNDDLPLGSELEIELELSESKILKSEIYIPFLDHSLKLEITPEKNSSMLNRFKKDFEDEKDKFGDIKQDGITSGSSKYQEVIDQIYKEKLIEQIEESLYSPDAGEEAVVVCENRLVRLKGLLDQAEDILHWPKKVQEARNEATDAQMAVSSVCPEKQNQLNMLNVQLEKAISEEDPRMLEHTKGQIFALKGQCLMENCDVLKQTLVALRQDYDNGLVEFKDETTALRLINQGTQYICPQDKPALQNIITQIMMLVKGPEPDNRYDGGGILPC